MQKILNVLSYKGSTIDFGSIGRGSIPLGTTNNTDVVNGDNDDSPVAQRSERHTHNVRVAGSSPAWTTKLNKTNSYMEDYTQIEFDDSIMDSETISQDFDDIDLFGERTEDDTSDKESDILFE